MKFNVQVEKRMYVLGTVEIEANSPEEAEVKADALILNGNLQTTECEWNDPVYEDMTFATTGEVE